MPNLVHITRGADATSLRRGDVTPGMIFAVKDNRTGRLGKQYAHIGSNGRMYSVNLDTQELASSGNNDSKVTLTGKWKFDLDRTYRRGSRIGQQMNRSQVQPGEVFTVKGGEREYAHLGAITLDHNGWLSVPLDNTDNHAVTHNGDSTVTIVGTFQLKATLTK